ncbi:2,3-bisphosphoglycerate-independent phosphoglycerate mutase [bacterium]|nr:2,3-bisphosphoglycerate-independent phosphoglycerate mutase [bacterium]
MQRVILCILDGYGLAPDGPFNAVTRADTPFLDWLWSACQSVTLKTSGEDVGLPEGQMGNSEVGHLNIGAGRVVYQDITRIDKSVRDGDFFENPVLLDLLDDVKKSGRALHLLGLVSDGGVHSSVKHLRAILQACKLAELDDVVLHAFTDGRDTPPHSGLAHIATVENWMQELKTGRIGTVSGRYYAMDRDKRWERVEKAYRALCSGEGNHAPTARDAVTMSYDSGVTDEFIIPTVIDDLEHDNHIHADDAVLFFNFRSDRTRQLTSALNFESFDGFKADVKVARYVTMTKYREDYPFPVLYPPQRMNDLLGGILASRHLLQMRIAETEKYPHVTFFFNGGDDSPFAGEDRILVPSPKVATYDLQPEMSEPEVTRNLCEAIRSDRYDFICINFANCDMVGHTGVLKAAIRSVEAANHGAEEMCRIAKEHGYAILITADHGNAEQMWDEKTNGPHTAHTTNVVPLALFNGPEGGTLRDGGRLADLAPTILDLMRIEQPNAMSGESLLIRK